MNVEPIFVFLALSQYQIEEYIHKTGPPVHHLIKTYFSLGDGANELVLFRTYSLIRGGPGVLFFCDFLVTIFLYKKCYEAYNLILNK